MTNLSFVRFRPDGEIFAWGQAPAMDVPVGPDVLIGSGAQDTHYVKDGAIVPYTRAQITAKAQRPSLFHRWRNDTFAWTDTRSQSDLNAEAVAAVKTERSRRLNETDWIITKSVELGLTISPEWRVHRQALRDVTLQPGYPFNVVWPTAPVETNGRSHS